MNQQYNRYLSYENATNYNIIGKIPVIIKIDARSFANISNNITKPFCHKTSALFSKTMFSLVKQIDGVVFGYHYSDKIILVLRNDKTINTEPWFGNNIQKISSVASSIATYEFLTNYWGINNRPELNGNIVFKANTFAVPDINEAINYILYKQFHCMRYAVYETLYYKFGDKTDSLLTNKNIEERIKIINDAGIDFNSYPTSFRYGVSTYLVPKLIDTNNGQITKLKWIIDFNTPLFSENKNRLTTILNTGSDIFRPERDLNDTE